MREPRVVGHQPGDGRPQGESNAVEIIAGHDGVVATAACSVGCASASAARGHEARRKPGAARTAGCRDLAAPLNIRRPGRARRRARLSTPRVAGTAGSWHGAARGISLCSI
jgi:hypothetical protein